MAEYGETLYAKVLLSKAKKNGDCLECHFPPTSCGYPYIRYEGKRRRAHRFVWQALNHELESDIFVLHKCDNPRCINPDHLFRGTAADNTQDMLAKGRHTYKHSDTRKVFPETVERMKKLQASGHTLMEIASELDLHQATIFDYLSGRKTI